MEKTLAAPSERASAAEKMMRSLERKLSENESQKRKLNSAWESVADRKREVEDVRESLEKRARGLEEREREFLAFQERKLKEFASQEEGLRLKSGTVSKNLKNIEAREKSLRLNRESLLGREGKISEIIGALEVRIKAVEDKEEEFDMFKEGKLRDIELKEKELNNKCKEFADHVREGGILKHRFMERMELAENKIDAARVKMDEKFKEIELRANAGWDSLASRVKEAGFIMEAVEKKMEELEKTKKEFKVFQEEKIRELASKEQLLVVMSEKLVKDTALRNELLIEQEKLVYQLLQRLELAKDNVDGLKNFVSDRFLEISLKEADLESNCDLVKKKMVEADLRAKEFEEREERIAEKKYHLTAKEKSLLAWEKKLEDKQKEVRLARKASQQLLEELSKKLMGDAELSNDQLIQKVKLGHELLERLRLAKDDVEGLKRRVHERFVKIGIKETEIESIRDWVEKKMDEADSKAEEVGIREEIIAKKEEYLLAWQKVLGDKQKELEDEQKDVDLARETNEQRLEKLVASEKNVKSVRKFLSNCYQEHRAIKKTLKTERELVEQNAKNLAQRDEYLNDAEKDLELREKQIRDIAQELGLIQQHYTYVFNAPLKIKPNESEELTFTLRMDGRTLQMFLNDYEKDCESMGDEVFKVLHLSSDPAKLVLDAMVGFHPPHLREQDGEINVRRTCITLLEQLTKMSPNIKPNVREEAMKLATSWKSKMRATVENAKSQEVLGFMLLLKAFNLASCFDNDEVSCYISDDGRSP